MLHKNPKVSTGFKPPKQVAMLTVTGAELLEAVQEEKDLESELLRLVIVNWQPGAGPGARRETYCVVRLVIVFFRVFFRCVLVPGSEVGADGGGSRLLASRFLGLLTFWKRANAINTQRMIL